MRKTIILSEKKISIITIFTRINTIYAYSLRPPVIKVIFIGAYLGIQHSNNAKRMVDIFGLSAAMRSMRH